MYSITKESHAHLYDDHIELERVRIKMKRSDQSMTHRIHANRMLEIIVIHAFR